MGKIILENITLFGFHGCMKEESNVGSYFEINLEIDTNLDKSGKTDELSDTIDYVDLYQIIKKEMMIRSKLIESVSQRIIQEIKKKYNDIFFIKVKICKLSPPVGGEIEKVCIIMTN